MEESSVLQSFLKEEGICSETHAPLSNAPLALESVLSPNSRNIAPGFFHPKKNLL